MPGFDKTGPLGQGSMTGRGFGPCGRGFSQGRGYGRGLGRCFGWNHPQTKEEKIEDLKGYKKALQEELKNLDNQLVNLQKSE